MELTPMLINETCESVAFVTLASLGSAYPCVRAHLQGNPEPLRASDQVLQWEAHRKAMFRFCSPLQGAEGMVDQAGGFATA